VSLSTARNGMLQAVTQRINIWRKTVRLKETRGTALPKACRMRSSSAVTSGSCPFRPIRWISRRCMIAFLVVVTAKDGAVSRSAPGVMSAFTGRCKVKSQGRRMEYIGNSATGSFHHVYTRARWQDPIHNCGAFGSLAVRGWRSCRWRHPAAGSRRSESGTGRETARSRLQVS